MDPKQTQAALLNLVKIAAAAEALAVYCTYGPGNVDEHIRVIRQAANHSAAPVNESGTLPHT